MNKIQYIKLFEIRGITEMPKGHTIKSLLVETGGEPSLEEMVQVNKLSMEYFITEKNVLKERNKELQSICNKLEEKVQLLDCLEAVGLDNWIGYEQAIDLMKEIHN